MIKTNQLNALVAAVRKCSPWFLVSVGTRAFGHRVAPRTVRRGRLGNRSVTLSWELENTATRKDTPQGRPNKSENRSQFTVSND